MKLIFMGTPAFSVPPLKRLAADGHEITAVYTRPPKPVGRGKKISASPVQQFAEEKSIPVRTPRSLRNNPDELEWLKKQNADLAVVCAYGLILPEEILYAPRLGCINIHASLLPRWRGASPIQAALLAGDRETGITLMQMDAGLDTGAMLDRRTLPITPEDTAASLHERLSEMGAEAISELLGNPLPLPVPQPETGVTHSGKISKSDGRIDWHDDAAAIERKFRAYFPYPGIYTYFNGELLRIGGLSLMPTSAQSAPPGTVLTEDLAVACGQGAVRLEVLQKPGKSMLKVRDFLNGQTLVPGDVLG